MEHAGGQTSSTRAAPTGLWVTAPGRAARDRAAEGSGVACRMRYSGISRGTEALVLHGRVPQSEHARMRAPFQEGDFSFPVKYGYAAVAEVCEGPMAGQTVFALHPHQDWFRLPPEALLPLPDGVPPERAVLGANMETALNIVWDSGAGPGDHVVVMGAGVVGALVASLCARLPGTAVTLCDLDAARAALATALGCAFAAPDAAPGGADVVINASGSGAALARALELAGPGATVVEASWHGTAQVALPLGGAFHSQRLRLVSSQVGDLPPARLPRWDHRRRLATALELLADDRLDALISGQTAFAQLAGAYAAILSDPGTLCHRVVY